MSASLPRRERDHGAFSATTVGSGPEAPDAGVIEEASARLKYQNAALLSCALTTLIRPVRADDAARERDFICGLSAESRYNRLMLCDARAASGRSSSNAHGARKDQHHSMAYVAVVGDGAAQRIIGVARYAAAPGQLRLGRSSRSRSPTHGNRARCRHRPGASTLLDHAREQAHTSSRRRGY